MKHVTSERVSKKKVTKNLKNKIVLHSNNFQVKKICADIDIYNFCV